MNKLGRLFRKQRGVTAIEYALLAAAIAALMVGVMGSDSELQKAIKQKFGDIATEISDSGGTGQ